MAYDHQEGRVACHTLDGSGALTASQHYLLDRMNPTGYEQVLEQAAGLDGSPTRSFVLGLSLILQADGSTLRNFLFDGHIEPRQYYLWAASTTPVIFGLPHRTLPRAFLVNTVS